MNKLLFFTLATILGLQSSAFAACELSADDQSAIRAVVEKYRTSWLKNDPTGVQSTFASDAVLLPADGAAPVVGIDAIKTFWWPAGAPPTTITRLDITTEAFGGDCRVAFVRGHDTVSWTTEGQPDVTTGSGTYLNVMKKLPDGSWRIWQHIWDTPAASAAPKKQG